MRSTDTNPYANAERHPRPPAERFGELVSQLAIDAGYDIRPDGGGRAALARAIGSMSTTATNRMLRGETLPDPSRIQDIARALGVHVRDLLVAAGVISADSWAYDASDQVLSVTPEPRLTPHAAADRLGIREPYLRSMLIATMMQAQQLQEGQDDEDRLLADTGTEGDTTRR